jgi:hypothetical protein
MKQLFKATNDTNQPVFAFEFGGTAITNPLVSECSRFSVDPKYYGFKTMSTGSGNTAHFQDFDWNGKTVRMMIAHDGNAITKDTIIASVWVTNADGTDQSTIGDGWEVSR